MFVWRVGRWRGVEGGIESLPYLATFAKYGNNHPIPRKTQSPRPADRLNSASFPQLLYAILLATIFTRGGLLLGLAAQYLESFELYLTLWT